MDSQNQLRKILTDIQDGSKTIEEGLAQLRDLPFLEIGPTLFDLHRSLRSGLPEVIYAEHKTVEQVAEIFARIGQSNNILATRVSPEMAAQVLGSCPHCEYSALGRTLVSRPQEICYRSGEILIITAGTSDLPVAEEARVTCEMLGNRARILSDVGVAGIHRLFHRLDEIRAARVIIVVAGMEGALASVVGGLASQPIIAVPTSVGYGAHFQGVSTLLAMLTSCAGGITVVNIDNGYGAACAASRINSLVLERENE